MANALTISTFLPIHPIIYSREEWDTRVKQDLDALASLAAIVPNHKYFFSEKGNQFCRSDWQIADHLKGWIGEWAGEWLARGEEVAFRKLWRLSVKDSIEGVLSIQSRITTTLNMASNSIEQEDRVIAIDIDSLKKNTGEIQAAVLAAGKGLDHLNTTYASCPDKGKEMERVSAGFIKTVQRLTRLINWKIVNRRGNLELIASIKLSESISHSIPLQKPPEIRLPFIQTQDVEHLAFNQTFLQNLRIMELYLETLALPLSSEEKQIRRYKPQQSDFPWTVLVTPEGRKVLHCHITLVPVGKGGNFKSDKLAYCTTQKVCIAKLSTKISSEESEVRARKEEQFLRRCTEKKLPNIVETYEVIWMEGKKGRKQVIYQKYCPHGELKNSLERLKDEHKKRKTILKGILRGLAALHKEGIVHLDLKPANIFLDENDEPFIGDFGFAEDQDADASPRGSPLFMDPSIDINAGKCKAFAHYDIWSFGMLMYGMLVNSPDPIPWEWLVDAKNYLQIREYHLKFKDICFPEPSIRNVYMHTCWEALQLDPARRPTAQQMLDRLEKGQSASS